MKSFLLVSLLLSLTACNRAKQKGNDSGDTAGAKVENNRAQQPIVPSAKETTEEFRNIFYSYANSKFSKEEVQKLVYLPPADVLALRGQGSDPAQRLKTLGEASSLFKPSQLYDYGKSVDLQEIASVDSIFAKNGPITIVVVPGIFSEFVESYNFYEMIENSKSALSIRYQSALSDAKDSSLKVDSSFDFEGFGYKDVPMGKLIRAASYDDANGKPLIQVVVLRTLPFSGESVGSLEENSTIFLRRMEKFFTLVGEPENLYILGYSRGASVALQMIVDLQAKELAWKNKLRGMISLGGVLYGAALADAAFDPADPLQAIAARIKDLSDSLELPAADSTTASTLAKATRNSGRWVAASAEVAAKVLKLPLNPGLKLENISSTRPQLDANVRMLKEIAFDRFNLSDTGISEYFLNIKKFKWILDRAFQGIEGLSTKARIAWWKTHTVPSNIKYYSLSGVMGDVSSESTGVWDIASNSLAYNSKALDFLSLRISYYQLFRVSKNQLTDSQVSVDRSRFVMETNKILNPNQDDFPTYYMGILGVDHWGMSFPYATVTKNEDQSPFPRSILIQSIGNFVARHQ